MKLRILVYNHFFIIAGMSLVVISWNQHYWTSMSIEKGISYIMTYYVHPRYSPLYDSYGIWIIQHIDMTLSTDTTLNQCKVFFDFVTYLRERDNITPLSTCLNQILSRIKYIRPTAHQNKIYTWLELCALIKTFVKSTKS